MRSDSVKARFEALLIPVLGPALATAMHYARNRVDAENLVQEASLRAYRSFHTFREGTNFRAWFLRIVTNLFLEQYRQQRRRPPAASLDEAPDLYFYTQVCEAGLLGPSDDPAARVLDRIEREQVVAALQALPAEYRVVCVLYFVQDLQYQEISEMLGVPLGTVRSRIHRGRKLLQKELWGLARAAGLQAGVKP